MLRGSCYVRIHKRSFDALGEGERLLCEELAELQSYPELAAPLSYYGLTSSALLHATTHDQIRTCVTEWSKPPIAKPAHFNLLNQKLLALDADASRSRASAQLMFTRRSAAAPGRVSASSTTPARASNPDATRSGRTTPGSSSAANLQRMPSEDELADTLHQWLLQCECPVCKTWAKKMMMRVRRDGGRLFYEVQCHCGVVVQVTKNRGSCNEPNLAKLVVHFTRYIADHVADPDDDLYAPEGSVSSGARWLG